MFSLVQYYQSLWRCNALISFTRPLQHYQAFSLQTRTKLFVFDKLTETIVNITFTFLLTCVTLFMFCMFYISIETNRKFNNMNYPKFGFFCSQFNFNFILLLASLHFKLVCHQVYNVNYILVVFSHDGNISKRSFFAEKHPIIFKK